MRCIEDPERRRWLRRVVAGTGVGATALLSGCGSNAGTPFRLGPPRGDSPEYHAYQRRMAQRIVAVNGDRCFDGEPPDPLLAIPVLQIELNRDGSVRRIDVLREPRQARETTGYAIAAVRRAAPYGPVGHLPGPWVFTETFLFDDDRRFKPRTLD